MLSAQFGEMNKRKEKKLLNLLFMLMRDFSLSEHPA